MSLQNSPPPLPPPGHASGDEADAWRDTLSSIAAELQRIFAFGGRDEHVQRGRREITAAGSDHRLRDELSASKEEITKLKRDIRKACILAKEIIGTKEKENKSLSTLLKNGDEELSELRIKIENSNHIIKKLSLDNQVLGDKLECITNFINLGYRELQNINGNGEPTENIPVTLELRKIIVSCGQYYADYFNEQQKSLHYAQRNLFLINKVKALENILQTKQKELDDIRHKNLRLQNENRTFRDKVNDYIARTDKKNSAGNVSSQANIKEFGVDEGLASIQRDILYVKDILLKFNSNFQHLPNNKLSTTDMGDKGELHNHVSMISNLLKDQDFMLQELKQISKDLLPEMKTNKFKEVKKYKGNSSVRLRLPSSKNFVKKKTSLDFKSYCVLPENDIDHQSMRANLNSDKYFAKLRERTNRIIRRSLNSETLVIYKNKSKNDENSTICGITSEMQQILNGSVATRVKALESLSSEKESKISSTVTS